MFETIRPGLADEDRAAMCVVVGAGGEGIRMGGGKPMRDLAGRPLISYALDLASRWSDNVALAVRDVRQVEGVDERLPRLVDGGTNGPIEGLISAFAFARHRRLATVLMIPCDAPFLPMDLPGRLQAANAPVAIAVSGGSGHPTCSLWRTAHDLRTAPYLGSGRSSLAGLAASHAAARVVWRHADFDPFLNVNDESTLELAAAFLRRDRDAGVRAGGDATVNR